MLITGDGACRRGHVVPLKETADLDVADCPTIEKVLVLRRTGQDVTMADGRDVWWAAVEADPAGKPGPPGQPDPLAEPVPPSTDPETPYMIIYTSGTTGRPKGAVHVHGGFPIKAAQDLAHTFDLEAGDAQGPKIQPRTVNQKRASPAKIGRAHD